MACAVCGSGVARELVVCADCGRDGCLQHAVVDLAGAGHHGVCPPAEGFASNMQKLAYEERRRAAAAVIASETAAAFRATREAAFGPRLADAARVLTHSPIRSFALFETRTETVGRVKKHTTRADSLIGLAWVVIAPEDPASRTGYEVLTENAEVYRGARIIWYCDDQTHTHTRQCSRGLGVTGDAARAIPPGDLTDEFVSQLGALVGLAEDGMAEDAPS